MCYTIDVIKRNTSKEDRQSKEYKEKQNKVLTYNTVCSII